MRKDNLFSRWLRIVCVVALILAFTISCVGCHDINPDTNTPTGNGDPSQDETPPLTDADETPPAWASNYDLPDAEDALARLIDIYGSKDKLFLLMSNNIARIPCPRDETVTINVTFNVGEYAKLILNDSIDEFNEVFAVINPHYKFAINYAPTADDLADKYSVKLSIADNLGSTDTSETFGFAHVSYYNNYTELGDFGITIKTDVFNNGSYLMTTFKHELMHLLGAGDAYKNSAATKDTIMQSYTVNGYHHFSATDVAFLDALYRNQAFADNNERILAYVNNYEQSCTHTKANLTATVYKQLVKELDIDAIKSKTSDMGYKNVADFHATIDNGITLDTTFGTASISFKELEYVNTPEITYYGSIDPQNNRYWYGQQKGLMGNAQGVGYVNYGGGIIYAAPNGSLYTILIKTGEYVIAFHLNGSFTNLADLSLDLWYVCK